MPQQEVFFEREIGGPIRIEVLKTYDERFAHEAFDSMDAAAQAHLWLSLKLEESYDPADIPSAHDLESAEFLWEALLEEAREDGHLRSFFVVTETKGGSIRNLYASPDWPSAENFAVKLIEDRAIEAQNFECPNIECGAVFSYRRVSCAHFAPPNFCPDCGEPMDGSAETRSDRRS